MAVIPVQKNSNQNASYLGYASVGGTAGYAIKYLIPVTSWEKDSDYKNEIKRFRTSAKLYKINKLKNTDYFSKDSMNKDTEKILSNLLNRKDFKKSSVEHLGFPTSKRISLLIKRINNDTNLTIHKQIKELNAYTKRIRPTIVFVSLGLFTGLGIALYKNINKNIQKFKAEKENSEQEKLILEKIA